MPIQSFSTWDTKELFATGKSKRWSNIARVALRKLDMLDAVVTLSDLAVPLANQLEAPHGSQHSIRINDQFRICFVWTEAGSAKVKIADYY